MLKKYKSSIHNIAYSTEKKLSREKCVQIKLHLQVKTVRNSSKQTNMLMDFDVRGPRGMDFFTRGSVIMDCGLIFCPEATVQS